MSGERRSYPIWSELAGCDSKLRGHDPAWLDLRSHTAYTVTKPYKSQDFPRMRIDGSLAWFAVRFSEESAVAGDPAGCPGFNCGRGTSQGSVSLRGSKGVSCSYLLGS